jgi:hypothetical protein
MNFVPFRALFLGNFTTSAIVAKATAIATNIAERIGILMV